MKIYNEKFHDFVNPEMLKEKLILISLYIAVYENFKSTIVNDVKNLYWSENKNGKDQFKNYAQAVLSKAKKNQQLKATLLWLKEQGAMTEDDVNIFQIITDMRNRLMHEMSAALLEGLPADMEVLYVAMLKLFEKISKWWICEIHIPATSVITPEQYERISLDEISSVNIDFLNMMTDIAKNSEEKYQQMFKSFI